MMGKFMMVLVALLFFVGFLLVMGAVSTETLTLMEMIMYGTSGLIAMSIAVFIDITKSTEYQSVSIYDTRKKKICKSSVVQRQNV